MSEATPEPTAPEPTAPAPVFHVGQLVTQQSHDVQTDVTTTRYGQVLAVTDETVSVFWLDAAPVAMSPAVLTAA